MDVRPPELIAHWIRTWLSTRDPMDDARVLLTHLSEHGWTVTTMGSLGCGRVTRGK